MPTLIEPSPHSSETQPITATRLPSKTLELARRTCYEGSIWIICRREVNLKIAFESL